MIGLLSISNNILVWFASGKIMQYSLGLGISDIIDNYFYKKYGSYNLISFLLNMLISSSFIFIGIKASKLKETPFLIGMGFFAIDTFIQLINGNLLSVGIHVLALYYLRQGFIKIDEHNKLLEEIEAGV